MKRRTVLKSVAALATAPALSGVRLLGQAAPAATFSAANLATLAALAEATLPSSLGPQGREEAVDRFVRWFRNYRVGADLGHSYGSSQVRGASGPPPGARYPEQFAALDEAARKEGGASFAALASDKRRVVLEAFLAQAGNNLPGRPGGANLITDFMGMYFSSAAATDLAYNAAIGRDTCRGLEGSEKEPGRLR